MEQIKMTIGQFKYNILENPEGIRRVLFSKKVNRSITPLFLLDLIISSFLTSN